jgi:hypothetical protein
MLSFWKSAKNINRSLNPALENPFGKPAKTPHLCAPNTVCWKNKLVRRTR